MIECFQGICNIIFNFVNWLFSIQIQLSNDLSVSYGTLALSFIFFVLVIYFVLRALGVKGDDD